MIGDVVAGEVAIFCDACWQGDRHGAGSAWGDRYREAGGASAEACSGAVGDREFTGQEPGDIFGKVGGHDERSTDRVCRSAQGDIRRGVQSGGDVQGVGVCVDVATTLCPVRMDFYVYDAAEHGVGNFPWITDCDADSGFAPDYVMCQIAGLWIIPGVGKFTTFQISYCWRHC